MIGSEARRGRGRPRKEDAPAADTVLTAALSSFARLGFRDTTLRAIAEEAQVDSALIVRRYGSKFDLWRAVVDHVSDRLAAVHHCPEAAGLLVAERLQYTIARFVRLSLDMPLLGRFFVDELGRPGERRNYVVARIWEVYRAGMLPIAQAAKDADILPDALAPDDYLAMLVGAVAMPLMMRVAPLSGLVADGDAILAGVTSLFLPGGVCRAASFPDIQADRHDR